MTLDVAGGAGRLDVVVVGNVGIDTNVYLHGREIDFGADRRVSE